jgi:hypothetical protein
MKKRHDKKYQNLKEHVLTNFVQDIIDCKCTRAEVGLVYVDNLQSNYKYTF